MKRRLQLEPQSAQAGLPSKYVINNIGVSVGSKIELKQSGKWVMGVIGKRGINLVFIPQTDKRVILLNEKSCIRLCESGDSKE